MAFDENLTRMIRFRNLFSPDSNPDDAYNENVELPSGLFRPDNMVGLGSSATRNDSPAIEMSQDPDISDLYHPETRAQDRMYSMLDRIPQRNNPGVLRRIAAGIAGIGGVDNAEEVMYGPHRRQMEDFATEFGPVKEVAQQERLQNTNLRQLADSIINRRIQQGREERLFGEGQARIRQGDDRVRQGDERIGQGNRQIELANARLEIAKEVAKGGTIQFLDDNTAVMVYRDGTTKPIDANIFTPQERLEYQRETSKQVAAVPRTVSTTGTTTTVTPSEPVSPSQLQSADYLAAQQIFNEHPEWQEYIQLGDPGSNRFTINPPNMSGWLWDRGVSKDEQTNRDAIVAAIKARATELAKSKGDRTSTSTRSSTSTSSRDANAKPTPFTPTNQPRIRKEIPGHPGKFAVSIDGGKTFKAE